MEITLNPPQTPTPFAEQSADLSQVADDAADMEQALEIYRPVVLPAGDALLFYEASASARLVEHLAEVIEGEGPLTDGNLFRKVARAWGLERTGARVVERLRTLVPEEFARTIETDAIFYWPERADITSWERVRVAEAGNDASRRPIDEVCLEEISALAHHVLAEAGSSSREDVAHSVCRLLGTTRIALDAQARVDEALERLIALEIVLNIEGEVRLVA